MYAQTGCCPHHDISVRHFWHQAFTLAAMINWIRWSQILRHKFFQWWTFSLNFKYGINPDSQTIYSWPFCRIDAIDKDFLLHGENIPRVNIAGKMKVHKIFAGNAGPDAISHRIAIKCRAVDWKAGGFVTAGAGTNNGSLSMKSNHFIFIHVKAHSAHYTLIILQKLGYHHPLYHSHASVF